MGRFYVERRVDESLLISGLQDLGRGALLSPREAVELRDLLLSEYPIKSEDTFIGLERTLRRPWGWVLIFRCGCMAKATQFESPAAWDCCEEHWLRRREWHISSDDYGAA